MTKRRNLDLSNAAVFFDSTGTPNISGTSPISVVTNDSDGTVVISSSATSFSSIDVSGQSTVSSTAHNDGLTLVAGDGITITTDGGLQEITFSLVDAHFDSARALVAVDQAGYTKYDSNNFSQQISAGSYATQTYVTTQIDNLIDGAPGALNTLNELAAALNDDANAYNTLLSQINQLPDSAQVATIVEDYGYTTYDSTNAAGQITSYGYTTFDSTNAVGLITGYGYSTYDSTNAAGQIEAYGYTTYSNSDVDAHLNQSNPTDGYVLSWTSGDYAWVAQTGGGGGVDSAATITLITDTVDSAYIQQRQTSSVATGLSVDNYKFFGTNGQTIFNGNDFVGNTLSYLIGRLQVFRNGVLMTDSDDYTATNGSTVVLTEPSDSDDIIYISAFKGVSSLDSSGVIALINANGVDSASVQAIIDSDYVSARSGPGFDPGKVYTYSILFGGS
jgi:hypothetical protein